MSTTIGYSYEHNNGSHSSEIEQTTTSSTPDTHHSQPTDAEREAADSLLNTSNEDDDAHADAQLLSASILATIQSTPRRYSGPNGTPSSSAKSGSTPYHNGRAHDAFSDHSFNSSRDEDHKDSRRNGKTNNNMYPPSPTANITPRRRSTRVVKSSKPFPQRDTESKSRGEKEKEKDRKTNDTPSTKRDSKNISGGGTKRARKRVATASEIDVPQPVAVLGRHLDLTTLRTGEPGSDANAEIFADPNWAENVSLYSLARSWMCSGVDLDPFHILRHDTAESVLVDMHEYIPPPALPPPSTSEPPALPERPRYPSSNLESFQAALKKGCDTTPKALLKSYVGNCKTFRIWWKANYTQRLSKYKGRLAILFPASEQQNQQSNKTTQNSASSSSSTTSQPPRSPSQPQTTDQPRSQSPAPTHSSPQTAEPMEISQTHEENASQPSTASLLASEQMPPPQTTPPRSQSPISATST